MKKQNQTSEAVSKLELFLGSYDIEFSDYGREQIGLIIQSAIDAEVAKRDGIIETLHEACANYEDRLIRHQDAEDKICELIEETKITEPQEINTQSVQAILRNEGRKNLRVKRVLRWSSDERLLRLFRVMWERHRLGITYSAKLSFGIARKFEDSWIGIYWKRDHSFEKETFVYICARPWFPIRIHYKRSYGGRYV